MQSKRKRMRTIVSWSVIHMLSSVYLFSCTLLILLCSSLQFCAATATNSIPTGGSISSIHNQTLISTGEIFELGFFSLPHDGPRRSRYVGIWYYKSLPTVVVWVANRDNPLPDQAAGILSIKDGNLILSDEKRTSYFSTNLGGSAYSNRTVTLLDSGNLVFSDDGSGNNLWQSFDCPTDTFLPGMKMDAKLNLTSWTSHDDPRTGNFTFERDERDNRITSIWFGSTRHWRSGELGKFIWHSEIHSAVEALLANFSNNNKVGSSRSTSRASAKVHYISFQDNLTFSSVLDYNYTRLVMNSSGEIQFWKISSSSSSSTRDDKMKEWNLIWSAPGDNCSVYNFCGKFGSCNSKNRLVCKCLPGFKPNSPEDWGSGEFSAGCNRNSEIITNNDTFVSLKMMKVEQPDLEFLKAESEEDCREECLRNKGCQAYSYVKPRVSRINPNTCWLWTSDLSNLEEEYIIDGRDLYVRVAASDIGSTSRSCETCGTNMIPYPLSTASNCGDPMYFSFNCNTITGQVSFQTLNGKYRVSSINTETYTFVIQVKDDDCKNSGGKVLALEHLSPPFHVTNSCYIDVGTPSSNFLQKVSNEVEIRWDPPPEPVCASSAECTDWPNSSCKAREDKKKRCLCNESYSWDGMNLNCTLGVRNPKNMQTRTAVIIMAAITVVSLLCSVSYFSYRRGLDRKRRESRERMPGSQAIHMYDTERRVKNFIDSAEFNEDDKKDIDVPFFDLESILAATEYFSEANKLGQGGFGPVYKGKFAGEQEIAVKRLSSHSGQGLEEFKNEVVLIAKLQHRNLVRLLGYCVKGEEKILLYEYMPNKSLDYFIFDRTLCMLLDWNKRFDIILGIARGLLYLHQDSRLRIIHRDLKTGNILLDKEMNPKISDFGLARIVGGKETEANTNRVVGTYGYMSPEYALDGLFSIKSDVFSFGVILLEIVSGKRNTGFYRSRQAFNLLGYAWGLWKEEKALDLMDQALLESCNIGEVLKCIIVGLLCVQEDPSDRPNMSNAVFMLGSETTTLPNPKQPAFVEKKWMSTTPSSSSSKPETHSNFELTISDVEG